MSRHWLADEVRRFRQLNAAKWGETDVEVMIKYHAWRSAKRYNRKLWLFSCGCVRVGWRKLTRKCFRQALVIAEEKIEGVRYDPEDIEQVDLECSLALCGKSNPYASIAHRLVNSEPEGNGYYAAIVSWDYDDAKLPDKVLVAVARDVFANPFRPIAVDAKWLTTTVCDLAKQMYVSRDFSLMPILADALQDADCDNADILDHCLGPGPHVRGCWVVDLVLGKQ